MTAHPVIRVVAAALPGVAAVGVLWQALASRRDRRRFPPPGRMVDVGGHRLHAHVVGEFTSLPTVVLEAGMASMSSNWAWVRDALARDGRVVCYDRAGLGWSERGSAAMDAAASAEQLHLLLAAAGVGPPYVLAGHSYGGLVVRMFADRYPAEVVGVALVDASHPDQWIHVPASRGGRTVAMGNRVAAVLACFGLLRLFHLERSFIAGLPAREHAEMRAYLARPQGWAAGANGLMAWADSRDQVNAAGGLGSLPVVVLSVTEQDRYARVLTRLQAELATLSADSRHITVTGATHYTLVSERRHAVVVADAIRAVITAAQSGRCVAELI